MINRTEQEIKRNWKGDIDIPLVSICTITYNHEKYIVDALDSFLMQETDFPFEILIDEDCSLDGTANIIRIYIKKFPNIISAKLRDENLGGMINSIENHKKAKGKYLAFCEGDDYWTDPFKLQKQVDFLESHEEYNMVFHNAELQHHTENGVTIEPFNLEQKNRDYTADEILGTWSVATASVLCRNEGQYRYIEDNLWFPVGDTPYYIKCASLGKLYYMSEQMSVYRRVQTGFMDSGKKNTVEFRLTFIRYLKTLYSDFSDLLSKEIMDNKITIQYFWTAYRFKINGDEESCSQYMQYSDPQVIFEDIIKPKDEKIRSLEKHILSQNKTILELEEEIRRVKN